MAELSVKVEHAAYLRNYFNLNIPDPSHLAVFAESAGVDSISCHLRRDRLHIRDRDAYLLKEIVKTKLNLHIPPVDEFISLAIEVQPWLVTLMPDDGEEAILKTGLNFELSRERCTRASESLKENGIRVGYFINPNEVDVKEAARGKAYAVEFCAGDFINAKTDDEVKNELDRLESLSILAKKLGMKTYCGSGLNYKNIEQLVELETFDGFIIGAAITVRAMMVGFEAAVEEMLDLVR
ncbi:MAG: pyridoxine 5'-phosphate synthase [Candidatus Zixiibacteriota bacterium]